MADMTLDQKLTKFIAAKLLTAEQAAEDVVQNVVDLLTDEEVNSLIGTLLKIRAFADPIPCPPPIDSISLAQLDAARARAKKEKKGKQSKVKPRK